MLATLTKALVFAVLRTGLSLAALAVTRGAWIVMRFPSASSGWSAREGRWS